MIGANELHIRLTMTTPPHNKEYQIDLVQQSKGWVVNFAYGRIGNALQNGTKTNTPVAYTQALAIYNALVSEKQGKGYKPDRTVPGVNVAATRAQSGIIATLKNANQATMQAPVTQKVATGILPQLLTPIESSDAARFITDPDWWMQEKHDGNRVAIVGVITRATIDVFGSNRKGQKISLPVAVAQAFAAQMKSRNVGDMTLDGELIGDTYVAYDCLKSNGGDLVAAQLSYEMRLSTLELFCKGIGSAILVTRTARTTAEKQSLLVALKEHDAEGCVFKLHSAAYSPGRGLDQVKLKFWESASCIVISHNADKNSMDVGLLNEQGEIENWGSVTMIGHTRPSCGSIVEIKYLYAVESLVQPVFISERTDVDRADCIVDQLKFKVGSPRALRQLQTA